MTTNNLPTWDTVLDNIVAELNKSRNAASEAASWLRSDPIEAVNGAMLTDDAATARTRLFEIVGEIKALVDEGKNCCATAARSGMTRARKG